MLQLTFILVPVLLLLGFTNAQYEGANNLSNTSCISKYRDLETYVLNNKDLMDSLTETFFKTGTSSTEFVKIFYKFTILMLSANNTANDTATYYDDDDGEYICADDQRKFIWSNSALYLLGPGPLFWMTLFAVHVPENTVTIQLPCLCNADHDSLLSRLTYLVCKK